MSDKQTDLQRPIMTSSFRDRESAERAYNAIAARGYKSDEIHVLMSDETRKRLFTKDGVKTDMGNKALEGGAVGGAVGATLVGIAAAAAALTIPGLGLVIAGPAVAALAGSCGATAPRSADRTCGPPDGSRIAWNGSSPFAETSAPCRRQRSRAPSGTPERACRSCRPSVSPPRAT